MHNSRIIIRARFAHVCLSAAVLLGLAGCGQGESPSDGLAGGPHVPGDGAAGRPFSGIGAHEVLRLTGTEPFWGGTITGDRLVYTTPDQPDGVATTLRRFAGNGGLGFSGTLDGAALDLAITPGQCSDGMSDRAYPFTATLRLGAEVRSGCVWSDQHPFSGAARP